MSGLTRRFVSSMLALSVRQHPALQAKLRLCLADHLGCVMAGHAMPWAQKTLAVLGQWSVPHGSPVMGTGLRLVPAEAAFANGVLASSASRTDIHAASNSHPGAVIFPVLLALAAQRPVGGAVLMDAALAGYQAMGRLGRVMVDDDFRKRFRTTSVIGTVGGAIAAARLLGLDTDRAVHALSLAANAAGGLTEWAHSGGLDLMYQGAGTARAVVQAVLLAEAGCTASDTILEGEGGLLAAFGGREKAEELIGRTEPSWELDVLDFKPIPACVFAQAAAYAALKLMAEHGPDTTRIEAVEVHTFLPAIRFPGCDNPGPINEIQTARMSLQHSVAAALVRGELADENYTDLGNPLLRRLTARVSLHEDAAMTTAFPARQAASITATMQGGEKLRVRLDDLPGFTAEQVMARFRMVAMRSLGAAEATRLDQLCQMLGDIPDVRAILAVVANERQAA